MTAGKKIPSPPKDNPEYAQIPRHMVELLKDGNHKAYQDIFISHYNNVMYFIKALVKSREEAEELTQDIFASVWMNRNKIDPSKNFRAYLYTLARNAVYDSFRKKLVRNNYISEVWTPDIVHGTEDIIFAKELELLIELTVNSMPKQRKKIYQMSREQGLSNTEIAVRLDITKGAVERQLTLALKDIRKVLVAILILFS